jgi:hypothetical protein
VPKPPLSEYVSAHGETDGTCSAVQCFCFLLFLSDKKMSVVSRTMSTNYEYDNARTGMALALCVQTSDGNVTFALSPVLLGISRRNFNPDFLKG